MSFLVPSFLLLGLLAVPIVLFYMLRLRRREMRVSSTMLWQKLVRDREANTPWQRLRRNLLLILQLLVLVFLVLAMARPFLPVPSLVKGNVIILLDSSASMLADDVTPDRFSVAQDRVAGLIDDLSGDDQMTLIAVGQTPEVIIASSSDKSLLRERVQGVGAKLEMADWPSALALAAGIAQGYKDVRIVIVSDGNLPDDLPPLPAEVVFVPIGESAENMAISALAAREGEPGPQLFVSVANYGLLDHQALLSIDIDGLLYDSQSISVPAGDTFNVTSVLPRDAGIITARLSDNGDDHLPLDDTAWIVPEGNTKNRALIVSDGNRFLETIFSILPNFEASRMTREDFATGGTVEDIDLYVLDGVPFSEPVPDADLLILDPQPVTSELATSSNSIYLVTGVFSNTTVTKVTDSPILQFVDWSNINVRQASKLNTPWAESLVTAEGGPLLLAGEIDGRRIAIVPFRLQESDLPLQIAFPVLMANITGWLGPGRVVRGPSNGASEVNSALMPGVPVQISAGRDANIVTIRKPDESIWTAEIGEGSLLFNETDTLGIYTVTFDDLPDESVAAHFAVNLVGSSESNIRPVNSLKIGPVNLNANEQGDIGQRELWPWLALLGISVLLIEWWIFHHGAQLPRLSKWRSRLDRRELQ